MNTRTQAIEILIDVIQQGRSLSAVWSRYQAEHDLGQQQALLRALCFGVLRYYGRLSAVADLFLDKPLKKKEFSVYLILLTALYQLLYMRAPDYAVVSEALRSAVDLNKSWAKGLLNAILRRFLREKEAVLAKIDAIDTARYALPAWLLKEWQRAWPCHWQAIASASLRHPPFCLRVNELQASRADYQQRWFAEGATLGAYAPAALYLNEACEVQALPGFASGAVSVQDESAQCAAQFLPIARGARVLDACAAPGGKTAALLEQHPHIAEMVALDRNPDRLAQVEQSLKRLHLSATCRAVDAVNTEAWWDGTPFDAILLDVPCSATGVLRRNPDIKVHRRASDIPSLVAQQSALLHALWPLLSPGGFCLYATCSLLPQENAELIAAFVQATPEAMVQPIESSLQAQDFVVQSPWGLQILPGSHSLDGFFYALLHKKLETG